MSLLSLALSLVFLALSFLAPNTLTAFLGPLVVAGAALKSTASTIATVASKTPAELSQDLANNLRNDLSV